MTTKWYQTFFAGITSDFWDQMLPEAYTQTEGRFIQDILQLPSEAWVLDAPSGRGRMSLWLAQHSRNCVEGWDIDQENIDLLNKKAQEFKVPVIGLQADLTQISVGREKFEGAMTLGNCFGYFDELHMDQFIGNISNGLKTGGRWVIHSGMLAESIFPNWQDEDIHEAGDMMMEISNTYDPIDSKVEITLAFSQGNGRRDVREFCHYVYTLKEVRRMLGRHGLQMIGLYSGVDGTEFALGDEEIYIVVQKQR